MTLLVVVVVVFLTGVGRFRHSQPLEIAVLAMPLRYAGLSRFSNGTSRGTAASRRSFGAGGLPGKKTTVVLGMPVVEVTVVVETLCSHESLNTKPRVRRNNDSLGDGRGRSLDTEKRRAEWRR